VTPRLSLFIVRDLLTAVVQLCDHLRFYVGSDLRALLGATNGVRWVNGEKRESPRFREGLHYVCDVSNTANN
jgi:hypothetical protein